MKILATTAIIVAIVVGALVYVYWPLDITLDCETDSDCIPNACCHSSTCVNKETAPVCTDERGLPALCTSNCEENTLDCGQGKCICNNGRCDVEWKNE